MHLVVNLGEKGPKKNRPGFRLVNWSDSQNYKVFGSPCSAAGKCGICCLLCVCALGRNTRCQCCGFDISSAASKGFSALITQVVSADINL